MTFYTAQFYTAANWAETTFKAATPTRALAAAQRVADDDLSALDFCHYDDIGEVERIEICTLDGDTVAEWESADLRLHHAAHDLLEALDAQTTAAQAVIDAWSQGDLAAAVRQLDASLGNARAAIAKAKGCAA